MYAVITGASSGIGMKFAERMAKEGYNLIIVARRKENLKELSERLHNDYPAIEIEIFCADLLEINECERLIEFTKNYDVDIFINNAGFGDCGFFLETDIDKELNMIDLNIKAVHYLTKKILKQMQERNKGYILNVASSAGLIPAGPYMATYYATKAYVTSFTRAVAEELRQKKSAVYVGCLCPGPVDTEFNSVANVVFVLKGISAEYCANYAIDKMKRKKVVIIPTLKMKLAMTFGRYIPNKLYIRIVSLQQKKKIGKH